MSRKTEILLFRWLRPHHFISLMFTTAFIAFVGGYGISVGTGRVAALFPYISDTGTKPPASCVFGLFLNMAAVFGTISVYIRHRQIESNLLDNGSHHIINDIAMFQGMLSCLGIMLVACFQWTEVLIPHLVGAIMAFILGTVYCWLQSYLSYVTIDVISTRLKFLIRVTLSLCSTLGFVLTSLFGNLASNKAKGEKIDELHWTSIEPGYSFHLGSTFTEWIMAISLLFFFLTYYGEFKGVESKVEIKCAAMGDTTHQ